jgi:hypothetical protein
MRVALPLFLLFLATLPASADAGLTAAQYRERLEQLQQFTAQCRAAIGTSACSADAIGSDPRVQFDARERRVDLSWLRACIANAGKRDQPATERDHHERQLQLAQVRLTGELARLDAPAKLFTLRQQAQRTAPVLRSVLASGEFRGVQQPSLLARLVDQLVGWLSRALGHMGGRGAVSPWAIRVVVGSVLLLVFTLLGWWYSHKMWRGRPRGQVDADGGRRENSAAERWQLLLLQSESRGAAREWREAVHLLYWAAIARMESLGSWPGDRARTPREYLGLLPASSHRDDLAALTRTFERLWYGSQPAREDDFVAARFLFDRLAYA